MNLTLITSAVAAACGFGLAWNLQAHQLIKLELTHANGRIEQQRAARASIERVTNQISAAQAGAATRAVTLRSDAGRAASSGNGLRLDSADAVRAAAADTNASRAVIAAYGIVVDESIGFIREVSSVADQCISDNKALTDGWPK